MQGHSIGGSLAVLLTLMYRRRGVLLPQQIAPVYTFGSPAIFCDGALGGCSGGCGTGAADAAGGAAAGGCSISGSLLSRLGLPEDVLRGVIMSRDIVPRAFSCDYSPVAELLRSWGPSWREHSCLSGGASGADRRQLYVHVGRMAVLQPHPTLPWVVEPAPHLPALPQHAGLFQLLPLPRAGSSSSSVTAAAGERRPVARSTDAVLAAVMDAPHPLETLSDPGAYGSAGSISRYHNPEHYTQALGRLRAEKRGLGGGGGGGGADNSAAAAAAAGDPVAPTSVQVLVQ